MMIQEDLLGLYQNI